MRRRRQPRTRRCDVKTGMTSRRFIFTRDSFLHGSRTLIQELRLPFILLTTALAVLYVNVSGSGAAEAASNPAPVASSVTASTPPALPSSIYQQEEPAKTPVIPAAPAQTSARGLRPGRRGAVAEGPRAGARRGLLRARPRRLRPGRPADGHRLLPALHPAAALGARPRARRRCSSTSSWRTAPAAATTTPPASRTSRTAGRPASACS